MEHSRFAPSSFSCSTVGSHSLAPFEAAEFQGLGISGFLLAVDELVFLRLGLGLGSLLIDVWCHPFWGCLLYKKPRIKKSGKGYRWATKAMKQCGKTLSPAHRPGIAMQTLFLRVLYKCDMSLDWQKVFWICGPTPNLERSVAKPSPASWALEKLRHSRLVAPGLLSLRPDECYMRRLSPSLKNISPALPPKQVANSP